MSDEDLDWDDDFDFGEGVELKTRQGEAGPGQVVLSGVAANPDEEENWDDDFDLEEQVGSQGKSGTFLASGFPIGALLALDSMPFGENMQDKHLQLILYYVNSRKRTL